MVNLQDLELGEIATLTRFSSRSDETDFYASLILYLIFWTADSIFDSDSV